MSKGNLDVSPKMFDRIAHRVSHFVGMPATFVLAAATIGLWAVTGPIFRFSDSWQLVVNTGTTIVTFLMVFLIQNSQNRDSAALQAKLDELIRSASEARNAYIGIEELSEAELDAMRARCRQHRELGSRELDGDEALSAHRAAQP